MSTRTRRPMVIIFSMVALLAIILAVHFLTIERDGGPLMIYVDDEMRSDEEFGEDFDYSALIDKEIYFVEPVKKSAFVKKTEEEVFEVDDLRELWTIIDGLDMPNVVRGIAKLVCNGTYEDVVTKFEGSLKHGMFKHLGDKSGFENRNGFIYSIYRRMDSGGVERLEMIEISKEYQHTPSSGGTNFSLEVKIYNIPPMNVKLVKYQWYSGSR